MTRPSAGGSGNSLWAFVRLGRPQFLVGGFLLYGLGAAVCLRAGAAAKLDLGGYVLGQAAITALQLMTHYANDYFDQAADRANLTPTRWSGGSRILPAGAVSPRTALIAAIAFAVTGGILAIVVAIRGNPGAAGLLLTTGVLAWFYSAPPIRLHSRGWGELTTALVVTGLTPLVGFVLQRGDTVSIWFGLPMLLAVLWPLFGLQFGMLLAIEFPDAVGDASVGKRTLVVRWGARMAAAVYRAVLIAVYGALPLLPRAGAPALVAIAAGLLVAVAAWQFWRLGADLRNAQDAWAGVAFRGVALVVGTAAAELAALLYLNATTRG